MLPYNSEENNVQWTGYIEMLDSSNLAYNKLQRRSSRTFSLGFSFSFTLGVLFLFPLWVTDENKNITQYTQGLIRILGQQH